MSSLAATISSEKADLDTLSAGTRAYFQARLKNRLYDLVLTKFHQEAGESDLTKARLARRMGRKPEVVNRLLGAPGNWTLDTVSDLLLAIAGEELDATSSDPEKRPSRNSRSGDGDFMGNASVVIGDNQTSSNVKVVRLEFARAG